MRCKITGLALTLLLSGAAGCIREDLSGCRPGVGVVYEYSLNSEQENLFGSEVDKVTTYAFDENGIFVGSYSDAGEHLTNDYRMVLPLPDGVYTLVVWAGPLGDYIVGGQLHVRFLRTGGRCDPNREFHVEIPRRR